MSTQPGYDYGGPGSTVNRNTDTNIRYGVISCNSVGQSLYEAQEFDYGKPDTQECPACGAFVKVENWGDTAICPNEDCENHEEGWEVELPDMMEPCGWHIEEDGYVMADCLDNDAFVIKSPYYTYAQLCSPCVPGAGNLDSAFLKETANEVDEDRKPALAQTYAEEAESAGFSKVYCLGWDWFDEFNPCPYPFIFRVEDNQPMPKPSVD